MVYNSNITSWSTQGCCVSYRQEETAVLLQSAQEAQKGHTSDDDAADQQYVGQAEACQGRGECSHLEVHQHVHTKTQHGHATHLMGENVHCTHHKNTPSTVSSQQL